MPTFKIKELVVTVARSGEIIKAEMFSDTLKNHIDCTDEFFTFPQLVSDIKEQYLDWKRGDVWNDIFSQEKIG